MKKILLLFAIGYLLFATFPSPASAQCTPPDDVGNCPAGVQCASGMCCPFLADCAPPAAGAPAAGASTPTCGDDNSGTPTALGCIPNEPSQAIKLILPWAISVGGGLAFLLFLYGGFTLITAGSDPQKVDSGKSIITSAVAGLIFIILSILLLRVIGIDILKL